MAMRWYVVHAYSGFEKSVARALAERIERSGMKERFGVIVDELGQSKSAILVPVEEVVEMKGGQKKTAERKFFPGYVLIQMEMDDDTWHLVKSTPKVTGFIGGTATKPAPIEPAAPVRLSTIIDCPMVSLSLAVTARAIKSVPPPGAWPTMKRTGFRGYGSATCAVAALAQSIAPALITLRKYLFLNNILC